MIEVLSQTNPNLAKTCFDHSEFDDLNIFTERSSILVQFDLQVILRKIDCFDWPTFVFLSVLRAFVDRFLQLDDCDV